MRNRTALVYVIVVILITFMCMGVYEKVVSSPWDVNKYVAAKGGSVCYVQGYENDRIKYKKIFNSLEECESYIGGFIIVE